MVERVGVAGCSLAPVGGIGPGQGEGLEGGVPAAGDQLEDEEAQEAVEEGPPAEEGEGPPAVEEGDSLREI